MPDLRLQNLRGGLNNTDPPLSLPDNQATVAQNVEWIKSTLGERRQGTTSVTVDAAISAKDKVTWLFRHLPTTDEGDAELWVLAVTGTASYVLYRKTTTWAAVTPTGTVTLTGKYPFQWQAVSIHGKIFVAFKHGAARLHVGDGAAATSLRYAGIDAPAAPTSADTGAAGTFAGTRYYRVRMAVLSGSTTLRKSEPSTVFPDTPSGTNTGIVVTKPATIESATHWILEASIDNVNFYVLATTAVGTTTVTDTTDYSLGYAASGYDLSEDSGDYTLLPSAIYLIADEDRLVFAGDYENTARASRVGWTPVFGAEGSGNDERMELDTDPFLDLDNFDGGGITGLSNAIFGVIYAFKVGRIYALTRRNKRSGAYRAIKYSDAVGAIHGSVITAIDQMGRPCVYFFDRNAGFQRLGVGGLFACGGDIKETWKLLNINATQVAITSLYYPEKKQVHWWFAGTSANVPDTHVYLQTDLTYETKDGVRGGWAIGTGPSAAVLTACVFSDNIGDNTTRNLTLRPFHGMTGTPWVARADTGDDDNGTEYIAKLKSKPLAPTGIRNHSEIKSGALLAKAVAGSAIDLTITADFGAIPPKEPTRVELSAVAGETHVIVPLNDLSLSEAHVIEVEFADVNTPGTRWELHELALSPTTGATG